MTKERLQRLLFLTECGELLPEGFAELDALKVEFAAWGPEAEAGRLREALYRYGIHEVDCQEAILQGPGPCTCGLDQALEER